MQESDSKKAVVLLSGGLDSATAAAVAKSEGYITYGLTFDYGQRHRREIESSAAIARSLGFADHIIFPLDMRLITRSALTGQSQVPLDRPHAEIGLQIPATYVPARNIVFLSLALAYAETIGSTDIFIGVSQVDYSGYPDCRLAFIEAFERMANTGTKSAVEGAPFRIRAPLINMSKAQIVCLGVQLGVDYSLTWSCYLGGRRACGRCDSCRLRLDAFEKAGLKDPIEYEVR
ncbi:MAG: 7-cyano-7-deazaguanine synthase QueC [Armatimonadota bacterium]|nr:7-cyano-7-deazaguanine synthase QueC [Armatimonadota bacterium]